ncbi:hypothetical protein LTR53_018505, partial [Teratosphaeriaceae sp. CCFEE 6253]
MARTDDYANEESQPLTHSTLADDVDHRPSASSASTTSLVLEHVSDKAAKEMLYSDRRPQEELDIEDQLAWKRQTKPTDRRVRRIFYIFIAIGAVGWVAALFLFLSQDRHVAHSARPHDPHATSTVGNGKKVELEQVLTGQWFPREHAIRWIAGADGEDGLLLERGGAEGRDFLVIED